MNITATRVWTGENRDLPKLYITPVPHQPGKVSVDISPSFIPRHLADQLWQNTDRHQIWNETDLSSPEACQRRIQSSIAGEYYKSLIDLAESLYQDRLRRDTEQADQRRAGQMMDFIGRPEDLDEGAQRRRANEMMRFIRRL